ncbi:hypothetical protein [Streptomyces sp. NPDC086989]|uniref:hypothetical protein n=1 Tax=Streptomyces sp. NPDC086989 TaxID=3365764 RepID=UPI003829F47A
MTPVQDLLSRALLVRERAAVPRDVVQPPAVPCDTDPRRSAPPADAAHGFNAAAEDLRVLCETLVSHTPAEAVAGFVTEQVPEPRSALVLACVLQLTESDDGARFWWQYAAGAGQAAAAYCLYLHHLSLGEDDAASWWHGQTDDVQPPPQDPKDRITSASTTTILRVLHHLAKQITRTRSATVTGLMDYVPSAVAAAYLREPDIELPMPGPGFSGKVRSLLAEAYDPPRPPGSLPERPERRARSGRRRSGPPHGPVAPAPAAVRSDHCLMSAFESPFEDDATAEPRGGP